MNRRNFFKGVLGSLAACVVGKVVAKPITKTIEVSTAIDTSGGWWGHSIVNMNEPLLEAQIKSVCHNAGVPYRIFVCKDFDKQVEQYQKIIRNQTEVHYG